MSPRINADQVADLITTSKNVRPFINTANILINTHLTSVGLDTEILCQIELYLTAHFLSLAEERGALIRSSTGESAETFANVYGAGLKSTRFGLQALMFDTTGTLAAINAASTNLLAEVRLI